MQYIAPLAKLIEHFRALPGIGSKSAVRLAYHVLDMDASRAKALAKAIVDAKEQIGFCHVCWNFSDKEPCALCSDTRRDHSIICVVEQPQDVDAMERMREFRGLYHVLHGALSPLDGVGPDDIRAKELMTRIADGKVREVIMATGVNVEGEATAMYLARLIKPSGLKVTRISCGLPTGTSLEYADEITLSKAIENRKEM